MNISSRTSDIREPDAHVELPTGVLTGEHVAESVRTIADIADCFHDRAAADAADPAQLAYRVQRHAPVPEGTAGGLMFGATFLQPGRVGDEYLMTRGHFHAKRDAGEYYWHIAGQGMLVMMDEARHCWAVWLRNNALVYVPGRTAHRMVNTGAEPLVAGACWPADAGHDYDAIASHGFATRVRCIDNEPRLVADTE